MHHVTAQLPVQQSPSRYRLLTVVFCLGLLISLGIQKVQAAPTGLVTSTYPLYLLAQAATQGIEQPILLGQRQRSGHHLQLTPADRLALQRATLVVWIGAGYESLLTTQATRAPRLTLGNQSSLRRLPRRDLSGRPQPNTLDPHLWLDADNATKIVQLIAQTRAQQYPVQAKQYQQNASRFAQAMQRLKPTKPLPKRGYLAWHDAYQYLEQGQQIQLLGSLTPDPELAPTALQLIQARQKRDQWAARQPICLLLDPEANPALVNRLQPIRTLTLDETLSRSSQFLLGYQQLQSQLKQCLGR